MFITKTVNNRPIGYTCRLYEILYIIQLIILVATFGNKIYLVVDLVLNKSKVAATWFHFISGLKSTNKALLVQQLKRIDILTMSCKQWTYVANAIELPLWWMTLSTDKNYFSNYNRLFSCAVRLNTDAWKLEIASEVLYFRCDIFIYIIRLTTHKIDKQSAYAASDASSPTKTAIPIQRRNDPIRMNEWPRQSTN